MEKMKKRAKFMLPEIKRLISERALAEPGKSREILADELIEEIKVKYPKEVPPVWETVIRRISTARNHEPSDLEKRWHLGTIEDYPLPAEAIPSILKVQERHKLGDFTIRQARCVSYLYTTVKDIDLLDSISFRYAWYERICEISGTDYDTTEYDELLRDEKSQRKLIEEFDKEIDYSDFKTYKRAFEEITKVELAGINVETTQFLIHNNSVYAVFQIEMGGRTLYLLPVKDIDEFINKLKEQRIFKSRKHTTEQVDIIILKGPVSIAIPSGKLMGVKNEGSYSKAVKE